jgi:hypothetical protein
MKKMMKEKKEMKKMSIKKRKKIKKNYIYEFIKINKSELPGSLKCIRNLKSLKI